MSWVSFAPLLPFITLTNSLQKDRGYRKSASRPGNGWPQGQVLLAHPLMPRPSPLGPDRSVFPSTVDDFSTGSSDHEFSMNHCFFERLGITVALWEFCLDLCFFCTPGLLTGGGEIFTVSEERTSPEFSCCFEVLCSSSFET